MFRPIFLTLLYICGALPATLGPCRRADRACLSRAIGNAFPIVVGGVPSRGVNSGDPIYQEVIEGEIPLLKYKFTNTSTSGFKNCVLKSSNLNLDALKFAYELDCPSISMSGNYEISGELLVMPVEGKGTYEVVTSKYWAGVDANLQIYERDGQTYMKMTTFTLKVQALGPIKFDFRNLFKGNQRLSDAVHKFAHENWRNVARLFDQQVFSKNLKAIIKGYNKYLKFEPLEEIIIDY
ncbi:circadian clock-controlled protein daywake-like [Epargyreus clarus]|uniref:circadian clock-controlled protein daywake-like n=1 Tax=Epargyreus clarus TaxID=520877 RepID=UPI003C2DF2C9